MQKECDDIVKYSKVVGKALSVLCNAVISDFVKEPDFLDKLARILAVDVELRKKVGSRKLTEEELQQEQLQQQQSLQKLLGSVQQSNEKEGEDKESSAQSIDIAQLLQLMPKGTNTPPPYVSEIAIYATSLLKNLSLAPSSKYTIAQNESLMKEIIFLIIDISAGGWSQYNSLSICRNLLNSNQNKEEIAHLICRIPHFLNYLVGMASIHRVVRTPAGQLLIHTEAQRVVAILSQLGIVHPLIGEGAVRCICNYYLEQNHSKTLKLEALKSLETMVSVMNDKELDVTIHYCQEGRIIIETIVSILEDDDSSISDIGYNILILLLSICNNSKFAVELKQSNILTVLKDKKMDSTSVVQFLNKSRTQLNQPTQEESGGWLSSLVGSVKSWMYPNVNK